MLKRKRQQMNYLSPKLARRIVWMLTTNGELGVSKILMTGTTLGIILGFIIGFGAGLFF
jgi:hypothetical protein